MTVGLKNVIDQVYTAFLPKGSHPFVYMHLQVEPNNVDVNVHPTKHEVHFLYEAEIITKIREAFEESLVGANETRTLYMQQLLPGATDPLNDDDDNDGANKSQSKEAKVYAKDMIRTDTKEQKLDKFFGHRVNATQVVATSQNSFLDESVRGDNDETAELMESDVEKPDISISSTQITTPITTFMPILPDRSTEEKRK